MKRSMMIIGVFVMFLALAGCDTAHSVKNFEAPLAIQTDEGLEVVYRITFPEMTEYRYSTLSSSRDITHVATDHIGIISETINGEDAFVWIHNYFQENHDVVETDEHCMYAVELDEHRLCYRDTRPTRSSYPVTVFIEIN